MIALPQNLPYVAWRPDRLLPLCEGWLEESIRLSAEKAGFPNWELSSHIARAILIYLEEEFIPNTITVSRIEDMMARSIERIGFPEVARVASMAAPRLAISLAEIADLAPYELLFYPNLRERLDEVMALDARGILIGDIRLCVKILDRANRWRQTCEELRNQIIHYIREYLGLGGCHGDRLDLVIV